MDSGTKHVTSINLTTRQLQRLDLIALHNEQSRSAVIEEIIVKLIDVPKMTEAIAERLWYEHKTKDYTFPDFLKLATDWLRNKRIAPVYINKIIEQLKGHHAKNK